MYNAIRLFIAGYVWMTGFGNFSYYYKVYTGVQAAWMVRFGTITRGNATDYVAIPFPLFLFMSIMSLAHVPCI